MNDILVFSKTLYEHKKYAKTVLVCLQAAGLQLDIDKCEFEVHETKYLGLIIQFASSDSRPECIKMCFARTTVIDFWESRQSVKDV